MGAWGVGISSNDEYMDFHDEIMDGFNSGKPIREAVDEVIKRYEPMFVGDTCGDACMLHNLYFAAVHALWDCGEYDEVLFDKVKSIIEEGKDIECWREADASESDLKKRKRSLDVFLTRISMPKEKLRKPKPIKIHQPAFEKGAVLSIKADDGTYIGAVVMEGIAGEYPNNFIVKGETHFKNKPCVKDVMASTVHNYCWYIGPYKKNDIAIDVIGKTEIKHRYTFGGMGSSVTGLSCIVSMNVKEDSKQDKIQKFIKVRPEVIYRRQRRTISK